MTISPANYRFSEYAYAPWSLSPFNLSDLINGKEDRANESLKNNRSLKPDVREMLTGAKRLLEISHDYYNISKDVKDFILVPTIIMPSELPNKNCVSFSTKELMRFNGIGKRMAYELWKGSPTHLEHKNDVPSEAKGIIFDCVMKPIRSMQGDLWKVINLCGFDRNKDPKLCNAIATKENTGYSMGCLVTDYISSCCGAALSNGGCEHITYGKPEFKIIDGKLAKFNAIDILPIETSAVSNPAYLSSVTEEAMQMWSD
jgi:hypothetical protein